MSNVVLETRGLSKRYGEMTVVNAVSLSVHQGEVYGFLGPNGAGKTTVMRMLLGLISPSAGSISVFGQSSAAGRMSCRRRIGVVTEVPFLYVDMTAEEYLTFFARLYGVDRPVGRAEEMLERFGLSRVAGKRLRTFSQGMQQRVNLSRAFLHDPELLLLDEPIAGLDPRWIKELRDIIEGARARGRTVFLSSHLLSIVETVCDRVGIISAGHLLTEQSMERISGALGDGQTVSVEVAAVTEAIVRSLRSLAYVKDLSSDGPFLTLRTDNVENIREKIAAAVTEAGGTVLMVKREKASLEEVFLELTERNVALFAKR